MTVSLANVAANTEADALARLLDSGKLKLYAGSVPANADASLGGATLLSTNNLNATSAPAASAGVLTFNAIADATAAATGTAAFYRLTKSDDTVVLQGAVGTSGSDLNLNSTAISSGATVSITSLTHTVTK